MNEESRLILKALNYLLWVQIPRSDRSTDDRDKLMVKIYLALNPITDKPISEQTKDTLLEQSE